MMVWETALVDGPRAVVDGPREGHRAVVDGPSAEDDGPREVAGGWGNSTRWRYLGNR